MKDLFPICLEPEAQGYDMTFKVCNLSSKRPHLYRAYVIGVYNNLGSTVCTRGSNPILEISKSKPYEELEQIKVLKTPELESSTSIEELQQIQNGKNLEVPCLNCHLIQMGSAISYWDNRCPQCGNQVESRTYTGSQKP